MTISVTSPVTGAPVSGFTSPTYTLAAATAPNAYSKSWAVTAIGGTQTGADTASSISRPWTWTFGRPQNYKQLNAVDTNGVVRGVQFNVFNVTGRKGLTPLAGQASKTSVIKMEIPIPAGADVADVPNIKAHTSSFFGICYQQATNMVDAFTGGEI
jgi:hypothetical protein